MQSTSVASPRVFEGLDRTAAAVLVLLCACWGLNQVAIKVANTAISPGLQAGLRSVGGSALVLVWAHARGIRLEWRDGTLGYGLLAGLLFAAEFFLIYAGLDLTTAARGVLFLYTSPFVVALGAHFLLPGDRLTRTKLAGLIVAFVGLMTAFVDGLRLPTARELTGDLMCFAAAALWGATTLLIKGTPLARARPEMILLYQLGVSAVALPLVSLLLGEPGIVALDGVALLSLAYQIVVVAFASYVAWFWLVTRYPASRLAAFSFLTPVFGVALGGLLLQEPVSLALLLAVTLIGAGIYLVNRPAPEHGPA